MKTYSGLKNFIWKLIYNIKFVIYIICHGGINNNNVKRIVVSLTSFPERINTVNYTIKSMMMQSVKPDVIVLYLGEDMCNTKIPLNLRVLTLIGLKIYNRIDDLKGHKKYLYAFKEFPDASIITVDDDMIYEKNTIKQLIEGEKTEPRCVIAKRVHKIIMDNKGEIMPYNMWASEFQLDNKPSFQLFATGGGSTISTTYF